MQLKNFWRFPLVVPFGEHVSCCKGIVDGFVGFLERSFDGKAWTKSPVPDDVSGRRLLGPVLRGEGKWHFPNKRGTDLGHGC